MEDRPTATRELLALLRGHRLTDIVTTAVRLGIPDAIATGSTDSESIAAVTGTHPPTLYRLLRALASAGVLREEPFGRFGLTALGQLLRSGTPGSVVPWAELIGRPYMRAAWGDLEHSVRTGENAFAAHFGEDIWTWRGARPEESATFDRAMTSQSFGVGEGVAAAFDFGKANIVADIGGGSGALLASILRAHPHLRGVLFDQAAVVERATELVAAGVMDRCEVVAGSFFDAVPAGADVYVMKAILHDWEDAESIAILRKVASVIPPTGSLLLVERVVGPPNEDLEGKLSDLHMLVMPGGRERTREEWADLLRQGGFELRDVRPARGPWQVVLSTPVVTERSGA
ncbi:MAG TPA: methyltransferase [Candidatus Limnocylindria bacterium]|nr:methyltransferase [Candidatus Limnocylindria bacterium]